MQCKECNKEFFKLDKDNMCGFCNGDIVIKTIFDCFNKDCEDYDCMKCLCKAGNFANECEKRFEDSKQWEEKILKDQQEKDYQLHKDNKIKPSYYHKGKVDTITFCQENKLGFCEGNIVKYIVRYADKNGMEDLLKVREYLNRIIESEEGKQC